MQLFTLLKHIETIVPPPQICAGRVSVLVILIYTIIYNYSYILQLYITITYILQLYITVIYYSYVLQLYIAVICDILYNYSYIIYI